jgi:hypothetical protein
MTTFPIFLLFLLVQGVSPQSVCANQEGFLGGNWGVKEGSFWAACFFFTILPLSLLV